MCPDQESPDLRIGGFAGRAAGAAACSADGFMKRLIAAAD